MSDNKFRPICSGQCSMAKTYGQTYMALAAQDTQYAAIGRGIQQHRLRWLTPERMRAELAGLSIRIASARERRVK